VGWSSVMTMWGSNGRLRPSCSGPAGSAVGCTSSPGGPRVSHEAGFVGFPMSAQTVVATLVHTIFDHASAEAVRTQHQWVVEPLEERFPEAARLLDEAGPDRLAVAALS
jgi:hypothetical protein